MPSLLLPPSSHARLPRGSETILVVEDDKAVRGVVRALLEAQGRVLDAAFGSEALDVGWRIRVDPFPSSPT